jgi:predicted HTH domain antitoxin
MELAINLFQETEDILSNEERIQEIELPALKEVFGYVCASRNKNMAYTKHSAHTKTSTKGCPMGCLGG